MASMEEKKKSPEIKKEKKTTSTTSKKKSATKKKTTSPKKVVASKEKKVIQEEVKPKKTVRKSTTEIVKTEAKKSGSVSKEKSVKLEKKQPVLETSHEHFGVYFFLLSAVLVCLYVMGRFYIQITPNIQIGYSVLLFSTVYFIANVITKKFDFEKTIIAIIGSSIFLLLFVYFSKYLSTKVIDYFAVYGQVFAYIVSQIINLIVYYYLLVNTTLKMRWVYLSYLFSLMIYYLISLLFVNRIIITAFFWPTFFCSLLISSIVTLLYAFYDILIERGQE